MKIGIEAQRIFRPGKHGMDFVILEVLRQLQLNDDKNEYFVFVAPGQDHCINDTERMHIVEVACPTYPLWEQWALPRAVRKTKVDMLHCTSNTAPLNCPVPLVLTLHDIIYLNSEKSKGMSRYQQMGWYYRRWNVPRIVNKCRHIITVSQTERANIVRRFPQIEDHLSVVHNGYSECYHLLPDDQVQSITHKYLPDNKYFLFLGNTDPRKNTEGVLRAYNEYQNRSQNPLRLIITGLRQDYLESMLVNMELESCISKIICTGYVPGEDLPALYNGAFAFLCPSLFEGFGIPVLEAMACGTPVITSNCSSLPEVAGKGGLLVNPFSPQEITDAMILLETDAEFYQNQIDYGLERVKQFSWKHTAESYLKLYEAMEYL
ncbi:glycosyltransferase family 4 protein [Bacteroides sp.]|uniref:glycosyltransferase family 4 protein n=1 Tax=Bacteroides sp. TaxID=29523 RepID=UPI003AB494C1